MLIGGRGVTDIEVRVYTDVFSGSAERQLEGGGKLCPTCLTAGSFSMQKYEHQLKFLSRCGRLMGVFNAPPILHLDSVGT